MKFEFGKCKLLEVVDDFDFFNDDEEQDNEKSIETPISTKKNNSENTNNTSFKLSKDELEDLYNRYKTNPDDLTEEEKQDLLDGSKFFYYNNQIEIMPDFEYDELEASMGMENKNYVGSKSGNYTVKHSFIMGSLSKVQIKEDKNKNVDWQLYADQINSYLSKARGLKTFETTPKLDGCSFSAEFVNKWGKAKLKSCSTRGNGHFGTDISKQFEPTLNGKYWDKIDQAVKTLLTPGTNEVLCIRGEVLVPKTTFDNKYSDKTNPRSFVSGALGVKWDDSSELKQMSGDLHFVCYDYRIYDPEDDSYVELSWMNPSDNTYSKLSSFLNHIGELPDPKYCQVHQYNGKITANDLENIYYDYDNFRHNVVDYALDGIVFKPAASSRLYNDDRDRPEDCVAMKFLPMMNITEITDIVWDVKKRGEYTPIAIYKPFMLDGKKMNKANLHNYNYVVTKQCGIGSIITVSLAGDIIPFVYDIVKPAGISNINIPSDSYVVKDPNSGTLHLMKQFKQSDKNLNRFKSSCIIAKILTIGPAGAVEIWNALHLLYNSDLVNVCELLNQTGYDNIIEELGNSKTTQNYIKGLQKYAKSVTLSDLIETCCFDQCGKKASEYCAKVMSGIPADKGSLSRQAIGWVFDKNSDEYKMVEELMNTTGVKLLDNSSITNNSGKTAVKLTGSPKGITQYATKEQWLAAHPNVYMTDSDKEMKALICDDLNSTSGKMKKAMKLGVPIYTYDDEGNINNL